MISQQTKITDQGHADCSKSMMTDKEKAKFYKNIHKNYNNFLELFIMAEEFRYRLFLRELLLNS